MNKFENLKMEDHESITDFHGRIRDIANQAERLDKPITEESLILKVMRALPEKYKMDVKAIRHSHNVSELKLDEMMGILETVELDIQDESSRKKVEKQVAFHGGKQETGQTASDPDKDASLEQLVLLIRKFGKWNPNRGRNVPRNLSRNLPFNKEDREEEKFGKSEEDGKKKGIQCYECSGFGHVQPECPNYLKKKRPALSSTWSDDDDEEETEKSHCAFTSRNRTS